MITIISALAQNKVIGKDNDLIWHLPSDLKRFKKLTLGYPMIMGRKTFESLGKPLPGRTNIVVTRRQDYAPDGVKVVHTLWEALAAANREHSDCYIAGGAEIYGQSLAVADAMELTIIHRDYEGDAFFPEWGPEWVEVERTDINDDPDVDFSYSFVRFEKA